MKRRTIVLLSALTAGLISAGVILPGVFRGDPAGSLGQSVEPVVVLGQSFDTAVVIDAQDEFAGVQAEYDWVASNYPGSAVELQSLEFRDGRPFDILTLRARNGDQHVVYFDISSFFGVW